MVKVGYESRFLCIRVQFLWRLNFLGYNRVFIVIQFSIYNLNFCFMQLDSLKIKFEVYRKIRWV